MKVTAGSDAGVMSEAGMPGLADPGGIVVAEAHRRGIRVIPLSGPSSIILALISSGMNGQNFTFNGYLPIKPDERAAKLKELEKSSKKGFAQIFMETPYRNQKMLDAIFTTRRAAATGDDKGVGAADQRRPVGAQREQIVAREGRLIEARSDDFGGGRLGSVTMMNWSGCSWPRKADKPPERRVSSSMIAAARSRSSAATKPYASRNGWRLTSETTKIAHSGSWRQRVSLSSIS